MPADPYPIGGKIYNIAGSADTSGTSTVRAINVTKSISQGSRVSTSTTPDPTDGSYALDLSNCTNEAGVGVDYYEGDKIQIICYDGNQRYNTAKRHTVDISAGCPTTNLYFHPGTVVLRTVRFLGGFASNKNSSATYFHIYDIERDELVARIDIGANTTVALPVSIIGREIKGGMCIVYDGDGAHWYTSFVYSVK